jgi:cold shock CspA family protein
MTEQVSRHRGIIAKWFSRKRFGFIMPDGGGVDVFFHVKNIPINARDRIGIGTRVEFEIGPGRGGRKQAVNVTIMDWNWLDENTLDAFWNSRERLGEWNGDDGGFPEDVKT